MFSRTILAAAIVFVLSGADARSQQTLVVSSYNPVNHWIMKGPKGKGDGVLAQWAKDVEKESKGQLKIKILDTPLGKAAAHFQLARDGVADIAMGVPGYTPGQFVLIEMAGLPYTASNSESLSVALWRTIAKSPEMQKEFSGTKVITVFTTAPNDFFNRRRKIEQIDDFKGLKIRVAGGLMGEVGKALGVTIVHAPAGQAYELISRGVIDGIIFTVDGIPAFHMEKLIKYTTMFPRGLTAAPIYVIMNDKKFNALSKENREALMRVSGERLARKFGRQWDRENKVAVGILKKAGSDVYQANPKLLAAIQQKLDPLTQKWLAQVKKKRGVDAGPLLKAFRAEVRKVEAQIKASGK